MKEKRSRFLFFRTKYPDLHQIPGKVTYVGQKEIDTTVEITQYSAENYTYSQVDDIASLSTFAQSENTSWISVKGLNNTAVIKQLGESFHIHPLTLESVVNTQQRPKIEENENYIFLSLKIPYYGENNKFNTEHFGLILRDKLIISFQEVDTPVFDNLKSRIELAKGRIREGGADYLMFSILDAIVDDYYIVVDNIAGKAESLENELFGENPDADITEDIQELKYEIMRIKRAVQPLKEMIKQLEKTEHKFIEKRVRKYLKNLGGHILEVSENVDVYREIIWSLMEIYLATINNKMNEVMKVLTIMASIFIPLTFIAGVYGMNFVYMPELEYKYAYFVVLGFMLLILLFMLWYFRRKRWL